jgi:membrane protease YdiL (CAAX protease family)
MTRAAGDPQSVRASACTYFAIALGWSWLFWAAHAGSGGAGEPSGSPLFLIGGAGPFLAAVALTSLRESAEVRRSFWIRVVDARRIRGAWWLAALLLHPALVALAFATEVALGGARPALDAPLGSAGATLGLVVFAFWFGPLPEEIDWRGFALDRLRSRLGPVAASLVLGGVWALWHVPLFFVPHTFQAGLEPGSLRSGIFLASLLPLSVLIGWVYEGTARSTLAAALVHFSGNLCGMLWAKTDRVAAFELAFLTLAAVVVALRGHAGGPRRTGDREERRRPSG